MQTHHRIGDDVLGEVHDVGVVRGREEHHLTAGRQLLLDAD